MKYLARKENILYKMHTVISKQNSQGIVLDAFVMT